MPDGIRWVGLDVHVHESTIAIFDQGTGELSTRRVVGRPHELMPWLRGVARPARMVYEAGPTGIVPRLIGSRPTSETRSGSPGGSPPAS